MALVDLAGVVAWLEKNDAEVIWGGFPHSAADELKKAIERGEAGFKPTLLTEAARLAGRGMHPDDTVKLVRHLSGQQTLTDDEMKRIRDSLTLAQGWDERSV